MSDKPTTQKKLTDIGVDSLTEKLIATEKKVEREQYSKYTKLWTSLFDDNVEDIIKGFKLEFNKKHDDELYRDELVFDESEPFEQQAWQYLESYGWRNEPFDKQHWGNWLHSLSPYQGRITPSFSHWLIKIFSKKGDVVLDPFSGIGTIPLEADLLQRKGIGVDLSKYAALISKAKVERSDIKEHIQYIQSIRDFDSSNIDIDSVDEWVRDYFHDDTLREIIWLTEHFQSEGKNFLLACLMGILHGNRPGYLSVYTGCIIPMKPRKPDHEKYRPDKDAKEYRPVMPRLLAKIIRMYKSGIPPESQSEIYHADSRDLPLEDKSVDVIISSPPYYDTLDYVTVNRVRLYILGYSVDEQKELKGELIQDKPNYQIEMLKVGAELRRVLKPDQMIVFILGDVHKTKYSINTGKDISELYQKYLGFEQVCILNDDIPANKTASHTKRKKFDRVLVMRNANPDLECDFETAEAIEMTKYTESDAYPNEPPTTESA